MDTLKSPSNGLGTPGTGTPGSHAVRRYERCYFEPLTRLQSVKNEIGYRQIQFAGKKAQAARVEAIVKDKAFIPPELVHNEVAWFYGNLGIDDTYFKNEDVETIAGHILSLYGSKILAYTDAKRDLNIRLEKVDENGAVYIHTSEPGQSAREGPQYEERMDEQFLNESCATKAYRLETYRSAGHVSSSIAQQLRCYFISKCDFDNASPDENEADIRKVSDKRFLEKVSDNTLSIYQEIMTQALERTGPVVEYYDVEGSREKRLVIGYRQKTTKNFFSSLSKLYHWYGVYSSRKYVEQFSNGITLISCYLNPLRGPPIESSIIQIAREASLIHCLPNNPYFTSKTQHAVQEAAYAYAGWIFCSHFLNRLGPSYLALKSIVNEEDPAQAAVLSEIRTRFRQETFTRQSIMDTIHNWPELIRELYIQFALVHYISGANQLVPTLSYQRINTSAVLSEQELHTKIKRQVTDKQELQVLECLMVFNKAILKTNFFQPTKVALSFRLDPSFLPSSEYPVTPYGIFLVVGDSFRGFHVRFKDIARGGIRIVRPRNKEAYSIAQRNLFDENYALASTQASKNKDIPEGGSKGVILPDLDSNPQIAFQKFVDGILDLLIPGDSPGIKERIVDLYNKEEILFFGPDEGTAGEMDWAALHARRRGATWWKSFTTGKSVALGGIPHDAYGMTSLSVRQYTTGIYRRLGLKETEITKVQTGGPDGDLGSNEILLSKDKTIAIIDGSGTIYDPQGLNRGELERLARARKMISEFDTSKLGKEGYRVLVDETDKTLPDGEVVENGQDFRNKAHLRYKADILVPCGGRPEAINISNVSKLWDAEGRTNYKYIVEGANLFITQQARLSLERRGVILYKDASSNKGGVTSSSLEVLAGLAFNDEEFLDLMTTQNEEEGVSDVYADYVQDIQRIISVNAASEFQCIWEEAVSSGKARAVLTDEVGQTLIKLQDQLEASDLYENEGARKAVLSLAIPKALLKQLGLETILKRLPETYTRSLFASYLASHFIYKHGIRASFVDFYLFFSQLGKEVQQAQL